MEELSILYLVFEMTFHIYPVSSIPWSLRSHDRRLHTLCFQSSLFPISCNSISSVWLFYQISCSSNRNSKLEENWGLTVESPFVECKGDPWSFCGPCITLTGLLRRMRGYQDKAQESGHVNLTSHMDPCSSVISPLHRRVQNINGQQIGDAASA